MSDKTKPKIIPAGKFESPRTIVLHGESPMSNNKLLSRIHWSKRDKEVQRCALLVREQIDPNLKPMQERVDILVRVYFKSHPLDSCNIPAKVYTDGLRGWYIVDDDRRYVASTQTFSEMDPQMPRVEITLIPRAEYHLKKMTQELAEAVV